MIRSSRLAELQSLVAFDRADPRAGDSIAGTLMEVMAAASESTTSAFCDLVFCRMLMISTISVKTTANALTISATATNTWSSMTAGISLRKARTQEIILFLLSWVPQRLFFAQPADTIQFNKRSVLPR